MATGNRRSWKAENHGKEILNREEKATIKNIETILKIKTPTQRTCDIIENRDLKEYSRKRKNSQ